MPKTTLPLIKHYDPNAALVYHQQGVISQGMFLSSAIALAKKLPSHGYAINLCQDRSLFLLSFAAVLLRDMTNLLPPNRQKNTVLDTAADYADCFVVTDSDQDFSALNVFQMDAINSYQTNLAEISEPPLINAKHIAAITFTSGSTGKPSANIKPWRTLVGTAERLAERFIKEGTSPTIIATVPSQHMYGLEMTILIILQGCCSMSAEQPFYPQDIATTLAAVPQPRLLVTTPAHLRVMQGAAIKMPPVDCIISATAPLARTLAAESEHLFQSQVKEIYGCTEAGSAATRQTNLNDEWLLLDGMQLSKEDNTITISSSHLSHRVKLQDNLEILANNRFRFLGRANDILNVAGKRASLADINQKLLDINGIEDGVVFVPEESDKRSGRPAALVVSTLTEREILTALSQQVDPVFLPRPLRKVEKLPRNETGKLQHQALEKLLSNKQ
jgi:acyl-coenzyme A synthetase/AMP-(fatty) acid ligase